MDEITPEQKKKISSIVFRFRANLLWLWAKFSVGLFGANAVCIFFGGYLLRDVDPEQLLMFEMVSFAINFIFMMCIFNRQLKAANDIFKNKLLEVIKK